jgi:regulator of replication initiation timing
VKRLEDIPRLHDEIDRLEGDVARLTEENERLRAGIEALTERFWKGWKANGWSSPSGALLAPTSEEVDRG